MTMCNLFTSLSRSRLHQSNRGNRLIPISFKYIFNEKIDGFISLSDMTFELAIRCISYLCQEHHDLEFIEEEMKDNILSGAYRFHNFASTYWWRLIKQYLALCKATSIPESLKDQLQQLHDTRLAEGYQQIDQK